MSAIAPVTRPGKCRVCSAPFEQTKHESGYFFPMTCGPACAEETERIAERFMDSFKVSAANTTQDSLLRKSNLRSEFRDGRLTIDALPRLYAEARKETGIEPERYAEIVKLVTDFIDIPEIVREAIPARIFYLYGDKGLGKTWLLEGAVAYAIRVKKMSGVFTSHEDMCAAVKLSYGDDLASVAEVRAVAEFTGCRFLAIDDIGRKLTPTEWELNLLLRVIEERSRMSRPTMLNSNYDVKGLYTLWVAAHGADAPHKRTIELLCDRLADTKLALSVKMSGKSLRRG